MNVKNRVLALSLGAVMALSLTACGGDTTWAAKSADNTMPAGVYIMTQIDAFYKAKDVWTANRTDEEKESEEEVTDKDILKKTIEGKTGSQYVVDLTADYVRRYFAAEKIFDEMGLTIDEDAEKALAYNNDRVWSYNSAIYLQNGVSKESMSMLSRNYTKQDMIFAARYAEGGEQAMSEKDYEDYYNQTRARIRYLPFSLLTSDYSLVDDEKRAEIEKTANEYFERAKAGEDLDQLIVEYQKATGVKEAENEFKAGQYDIIVTQDTKAPSKQLISEMFSAPVGEIRLVEDGVGWYLAERVDNMFDREQYEALKPTLLKEMKQDEFEAWLTGQGAAMDLTFNDAAVKRYAPSKLNLEPPKQ